MENGKPVGEIAYGEDGRYQMKVYYPDGMIKAVSTGTYAFENGTYQRTSDSFVEYEMDGKAIPSGDNKINWTSSTADKVVFKRDDVEMICDFELQQYEDNTFNYRVFVYGKRKGEGKSGKFEATGRVDPETGKITDFPQKILDGDYRFGVCPARDGGFEMVLTLGKPVRLLEMSKEATPRPQKK